MKQRWPFRDTPNPGKGAKTYIPAMTSHKVRADPEKGT